MALITRRDSLVVGFLFVLELPLNVLVVRVFLRQLPKSLAANLPLLIAAC